MTATLGALLSLYAGDVRIGDVLRVNDESPPRPKIPKRNWPAELVELAKAAMSGHDCLFAIRDALLDIGEPDLAEHFAGEGSYRRCAVLSAIRGKRYRLGDCLHGLEGILDIRLAYNHATMTALIGRMRTVLRWSVVASDGSKFGCNGFLSSVKKCDESSLLARITLTGAPVFTA